MRWPSGEQVTESQVMQSWQRRPKAGVAVETGSVSNLLVLDVDPGHDGARSFAQLERRYGAMPETLAAVSGGGGLHLYFQHPGVHIGPSAGKLGPGLDIRCDRAIIVAPPSRHASGRRYRWVAETAELAPSPQWLLQALLPPPPRRLAPLVIGKGADRLVQVALERAHERVRNAPDGQKHDVLWRQAFSLGTLVGTGVLDEAEAERILLDAIAPRVDRASNLRAAQATIRRNLARGRRCPRRVSP